MPAYQLELGLETVQLLIPLNLPGRRVMKTEDGIASSLNDLDTRHKERRCPRMSVHKIGRIGKIPCDLVFDMSQIEGEELSSERQRWIETDKVFGGADGRAAKWLNLIRW